MFTVQTAIPCPFGAGTLPLVLRHQFPEGATQVPSQGHRFPEKESRLSTSQWFGLTLSLERKVLSGKMASVSRRRPPIPYHRDRPTV